MQEDDFKNYAVILKQCFFDTAIADIYRAIRGGSLIGAFTLSMCSIDALAYLADTLPGDGNRKNFEKWIQDWVTPLNSKCNPEILYAVRCGLVHTYGYAKRMKVIDLQGLSLTHNHPAQHWSQPKPDTVILNLDSLVAEVTIAAYNFFGQLQENETDTHLIQSIVERAGKLIYVRSYVPVSIAPDGTITIRKMISTQKHFAKMDTALAPLDSRTKPQVKTIEDEIRKIFA
jgi:hypothetical protein